MKFTDSPDPTLTEFFASIKEERIPSAIHNNDIKYDLDKSEINWATRAIDLLYYNRKESMVIPVKISFGENQ